MERDCVECGDAISPKRLMVNPATEMCINCQEEAERQGKFKRHQMTQKLQFSRSGEELESVENVIVPGTKT